MKTKKSLIYLFLIITFISCKKDFKTNNEIKNIDFDNKTALTSYKNFKNYALSSLNEGKQKSLNAASTFTNPSSDFTILENVFYESNTKDYSFVEFQIEYKTKNGLLPNKSNDATDKARIDATIDRLLIKKNKKSGIIDYELVSYIPDKEALNSKILLTNNKHNDLSSSFNGHVYHKNIGGETMYLELIENGVVTKKLYKVKNNNGLKVQSSTIKLNQQWDCLYEYCIEGYIYDTGCFCHECFGECTPIVSEYPGVSVENGIFTFDSNQSFYDAFMSLDNAVDQHNANFYDSKTNLTDEQVENIELQTNFDEFKPLRDFEINFGFASLRQKIENEENLWMENYTLNPATDPDMLYTEPDDVMRTFFNQNESVKIAGIYRSTPTDNEMQTHVTGPDGSNCKTHRRYSVFSDLYDNDTKRAKFVASFNGYYLGLPLKRIVARTKNYKKKSNGNWKKFATICRSKIFGQNVNGNCSGPEAFFTPFKAEKRVKSYKRSAVEIAGNSNFIKKGEMLGEHFVGSNGSIIYFTKSFTW